MKKVNYIAAGISALTLAGMMLPVGQVFAADKTKTSVAEINLKEGELTLDAVPDLNFGEIPLANILAGDVTKALKDNTVPVGPIKTTTDPKDGNDTGDLSVTDLRGTNAGWELTAQLGALTNKTNQTLAGTMTLQGANMSTDNTDYDGINNPTQPKTLTIGGTAVTIWRAAKADGGTNMGQGQGKNTVKISDTNTSLALTKNPTATAGQYQAAITWTLSDAPK
ncbi:WxL domain-containing protein [Lacticaseibacillus rhamnosus]|uniref:WxL domain-containing protein n=1 Tax=Lacticaseibacillus rhamnosus TaxID=47715 RepID=UPI0007E051E0|nr:WxL domain-containing protein [Lacticaseibacillus rhamnosus]MCZ2733514.1 WxL domain-containing protein [Lacticaseibacillus rhamnosus]MCZ2736105.1 WxL domain-containing protein [Lacticaseibacillus rhamnosus]MCZ2742371.1 WxL domain-containing protein [Lacticaseibacillus rhamnosus]MCZ2745206.1 WxL domain-containing protein [Lacticaseibacillus rhamnosus]MCZ2747801.1 WxL domain-containing protein [Lacticaseibacillus rhamnosus]